MMIGVEMFGHSSSVLEFVELWLVEPDGKRTDRLAGRFGHQPDDDARVNPPRQKRAERYIADHVRSHGVSKHRAQLLRRIVGSTAKWLRCRDLPVLDDFGASVPQAENVPRRQLSN